MKKLLLALLLAIPTAYANPIDDHTKNLTAYGAPVAKLTQQDQYLIKTVYAVAYSCEHKTPIYVVEHPTRALTTGKIARTNDFRPDPAITTPACQATLKDYVGVNYDRGHMDPADDNTLNQTTMSESFFLSNMVPQVPDNNRGIWKVLETQVRTWVLQGRDIYVVSGPMYDPKYTSIGPDKVDVPTRLFKVIVDKTNNKAIAFLIPNGPVPASKLPSFVVSIKFLEGVTGINFNPNLPANLAHIETDVPNMATW